jgi:hypothetical protein
MRDGRPLTTKRINTSLSNEEVDAANVIGVPATPCDIAAYYNAGGPYTITNSDLHSATYFGIAVNGFNGTVQVNVIDSSVHDIGDVELNGSQHGVAIAYLAGANGSVTRAQVYKYQKNGFAADGAGTRVDITDSRFRGAGPTPLIAQNGVQFSSGAGGSVTASVMEDHQYTACSQRDAAQTDCIPWVSAGLLIFDSPPKTIVRKDNLYRENDFNVLNFQTPGP